MSSTTLSVPTHLTHPAAVSTPYRQPWPTRQLRSCEYDLDMSACALGELRDSSSLALHGEALRERFAEDGYLLMRGFFQRDEVLNVRASLTSLMAEAEALDPAFPVMDAIPLPGKLSNFSPDLASHSDALQGLLYGPTMLEFYERFFQEPVRHYDYTWLRTIAPGRGTTPHCDVVYMGRGTWDLMTAWVPIGDISVDVGGLMILENSHRKAEKIAHYLHRDVDTYCENRPREADEIMSGRKLWTWAGTLSKNPVTLREKLGGRWLTADFRAGDLLTFGMKTIHGSLDNPSRGIRISSDSRYQPASAPADERWVGANPVGHGLAGKRGRIC